MIEESQFLAIIENSVQHHLGYLFKSEGECKGYNISENVYNTFEKRRELFLWCLQKALDDKLMRLAKHEIFLNGTNEEQVQLFRESLPQTEEGLENGVWFWLEECPGEVVWILDYDLGDVTKPIGDGKFYYWT